MNHENLADVAAAGLQHARAVRRGRLEAVALWRHRHAIVAATVFAGAAGFVVARMSPPSYESAAKLIVVPSESDDRSGRSLDAGYAIASVWMAGAEPPINLPTHVAIVQSNAVLADAIRQLGLDKAPYSLSPEKLRRRVTVQVLPASTVLIVTAVAIDPEHAAAIANGIAQSAVRVSAELARKQEAAVRQMLKPQLDEAWARFDAVRRAAAEQRPSDVTSTGHRAGDLPPEVEIERRAYEDAKRRYESARVQAGSRMAELMMLDPAIPPEAQTGPHPLRLTVGAAFIGFFLAIMAVLAIDSLGRVRALGPTGV